MSMRGFIGAAGLLLLLSVAGPVRGAPAVTAAVAANVQFAFDELQAEFTKETGIEVRGVIGSSGKLTAQIQSGAPYDVFLSADTEYPGVLQDAGRTVVPPKVYAYGTLVLWTTKDIDLARGMEVLRDRVVHKVAIPNPKVAPYGREAIRALAFQSLDEAVSPKLVYAESVAQVNQYITTGAVDVGFTAKSVVLSSELKGRGRWVELDRRSYEPVAQAAVLVKRSQASNSSAALQFFDFLYSAQARAIFQRYGYLLP